MNILILGSGGREHAFAHSISQSAQCDQLYIAPGNAGTELVGTNVDLSVLDFEGIAEFCESQEIDMLLVGPEVPLVEGIVDYFAENTSVSHVHVVGPSKKGAQLEGSKGFAKAFMDRHNIPTAAYAEFNQHQIDEALLYLDSQNLPIVLKADGLAAGKGVLICSTLEEAKIECRAMLEGKFGEASRKVVIEEYLDGIEFSAFVLTDGKDYVLLPQAKDYKRIGEGDTGLNTGGMGAISPVPYIDETLLHNLISQVIEPTINGLAKEEIDYKGFVFFGLMNVDNIPYVIEYNCRMGDPETEVLLPRLKTDLVQLMSSLFDGTVGEQKVDIDPRFATTVMLVSGGYPEAYEKGKEIHGLENVTDSIVYHAGTKSNEFGESETAGGRVLAITSMNDQMDVAIQTSMKNAEKIHFEGKYYRTDIGYDL